MLVADFHDENCQLETLFVELCSRTYRTPQDIHDAVLEITENKVCKCKNPYSLLEHARRKNLRKKFQDLLIDKTVLDRINDEGRRRKRTVKFSQKLKQQDSGDALQLDEENSELSSPLDPSQD